jgi:AraC-like DNA-binding protein
MTHSFWCKVFFLLLLPYAMIGQENKNDLTDLSYKEIWKLYFSNANDTAKQKGFANAYIIKAKTDKKNIQIAKGYYLYSLLNKENKAIMYLDSVIKYSKIDINRNFPATAYCEKAFILRKMYKFNQALDNYILAEKYALKNNMDYYYQVRFFVAITKSEDMGQPNEALSLYRECYNYYKNNDIKRERYSRLYLSTILGISDSYLVLNKSDSASYYNKFGYKQSIINNDIEMCYLFALYEGENQVFKKNYKAALDTINKVLPQMINFKNDEEILASYYYLGKAYQGLGQKDIAIKNFIKVDSMYKKKGYVGPEFIGGYQYIISYYKNRGDKTKQLQYLTTYATIDSTLQKNYKELDKKIQNEYDIPHVVRDKETLIQSLKEEKSIYYWGLAALLSIIIGLGFFSLYQRNLYKNRFEKIIADSQPHIQDSKTSNYKKELTSNETQIKDIGIPKELLTQLLEKLEGFENKKMYLQRDMTVQIAAEILNTNGKYISKIVNIYKNKSFTLYINDLRVDEAVIRLQENKKLWLLDMEGLASEFGFNKAQSFTSAFDKKTGLKPSFFIKELKSSRLK